MAMYKGGNFYLFSLRFAGFTNSEDCRLYGLGKFSALLSLQISFLPSYVSPSPPPGILVDDGIYAKPP